MATAPRTATTTAVQVGEVPVSRPQRDTGDRDVPDAVAHQGEAALDEVGADGGGSQADEHRGDQCPLHERTRTSSAGLTTGLPRSGW